MPSRVCQSWLPTASHVDVLSLIPTLEPKKLTILVLFLIAVTENPILKTKQLREGRVSLGSQSVDTDHHGAESHRRRSLEQLVIVHSQSGSKE